MAKEKLEYNPKQREDFESERAFHHYAYELHGKLLNRLFDSGDFFWNDDESEEYDCVIDGEVKLDGERYVFETTIDKDGFISHKLSNREHTRWHVEKFFERHKEHFLQLPSDLLSFRKDKRFLWKTVIDEVHEDFIRKIRNEKKGKKSS